MIAEEDIKVGAVVLHLGSPAGWEDPDALSETNFVITEQHNESGNWFTRDAVHMAAVKSNKDLFSLAVPAVDIARPVLSERKLGKVKMQLFDEGFPNAVMEIARVMTWAEKHKGYKPNDFKSLPNADVEFPAAASRHRVKGFIQKAEGVAPIDRVDEESGIVHLAHAAFNVLAELELVLTNKIK